MTVTILRSTLWLGASSLALATPALAQPATAPATTAPIAGQPTQPVVSPTDVATTTAEPGGLDEIVVTASKKSEAQNVQKVPFAVTAFGTRQLEEQHVRSLDNLSYSAPNVQLEDVGTAPGYANFSIRGLGINSSIPSIDPTVGVFVDGIYMGISAGILFDTFDLAGVEILRGPQGLLFGRNVTGGAVVVRTSTPGNKSYITGRLGVDTGDNKVGSFVVSGPLIKDKLAAKVAVYYDDDGGYFTNRFNGNAHFGKNKTLIARTALRFTPSEPLELIGRYEHGRTRGDGAVVSNFGLFGRQGFGVSLDEEGVSRSDWDQAIFETNIRPGDGAGVITNIAGYRRYKAFVTSDIDGSPIYSFHADTLTRQHQISDELRYAGTFGNFEVTTGLYYFKQYINYLEKRRLGGGRLIISGGGVQHQTTLGAFASTDWHVVPTITINAGIRYSKEKKRVAVANLIGNLCDPIVTLTCSNYGFHDSHTWSDPSFKLGAQWQPSSATQLYGFFARGFRSGGYNFRNGNVTVNPGPFDAEKQNSFEVGLKQEFGRSVRINLAAFHNTVLGTQREIITPVLPIGTTQVIRNSANVRLKGVEAEALVRLGRYVTLSGQLGYTNAKYTKIFFDLTADGVIDAKDYALQPPRLAPWTYGAAIAFAHPLGADYKMDARVGIDHRDASWSNDANTGLLNGADMLDANLSFGTRNDSMKFSVYGTNLLNRETQGNVSPLPFVLPASLNPIGRSTFSSINKGRVVGAELTFKY